MQSTDAQQFHWSVLCSAEGSTAVVFLSVCLQDACHRMVKGSAEDPDKEAVRGAIMKHEKQYLQSDKLLSACVGELLMAEVCVVRGGPLPATM